MELTLDQTLQQGIKAHKAGQIQEAENLYTAVLKAQPKHPDANHNMGVLAIGIDKIQEALPFFKTAVEANPKVGQFWLSYINVLTRLNLVAEAQAVLGQAIDKGAKGEVFDQLKLQLSEQALSASETHIMGVEGSTSSKPNILDKIKLDKAVRLAEKKSTEGQLEEAKGIYEDIIRKFPKHKQALIGLQLLTDGETETMQDPTPDQVKYISNLYTQGQLTDALSLAAKMLKKFPNSAILYNIAGVCHASLEQFDSAINSYNQALQIKPDYADAYNNLANTLRNQGDSESAIDLYKQALEVKPDFSEAYYNMGIAQTNRGDPDAAVDCYKRALKINPRYARAYNNMGNALKDKDDLGAAIESYSQALTIKPDFTNAHYNLGTLLLETKQYEKAIEHLKFSDFENSKLYLLKCTYLQNKKSYFFEQLDYLINQGTVHPIIGSLGCRSALKYGIERPNLFCSDPLNYVLQADLCSQYNFEGIFVEAVRHILMDDRISNQNQGLLTNGYQTAGNLFQLEPALTEDIQKIIRLEIKKYQLNFIDSDQGVITHWPNDYVLYGWLVNMKSGGKLQPHMHEQGWISGSIYINVPSKSEPDSGNLVVCIGEEGLTSENINQGKSIDVVTGSLCLFPASLLHYTIPFESEDERVVLAFDVVPKG